MGSELVERLQTNAKYLRKMMVNTSFGGDGLGISIREPSVLLEDLDDAAVALSAQEEQIERLRELLMEARNSADVGLDLNCRIDAALEGSKRDG